MPDQPALNARAQNRVVAPVHGQLPARLAGLPATWGKWDKREPQSRVETEILRPTLRRAGTPASTSPLLWKAANRCRYNRRNPLPSQPSHYQLLRYGVEWR